MDYYRRNRLQERFRIKARQAGTVEMLREWRRVPCADCGGCFEPHQMDFDHRDPTTKLFNLTTGRAMLMATDKLRTEAAKCDIVCANCHRLRTQRRWVGRARTGSYSTPSGARRMSVWLEQRSLLAQLRAAPCADCGKEYPAAVMEFDHRDPSEKRYTVSRMALRTTTEEIRLEVGKCDVICANCHRMRTYVRRRGHERE